MSSIFKSLFKEERGVSPVIGVILMVAITVILAAVIGTFVLGLGDSLEQAPQAQLDAETTSDDHLVISHNGGDSIPSADLRVEVKGNDDSDTDSVTDPSVDDGDSDFSVGDSITLDNGGSYDGFGDTNVRVIHEPSESIILDTEVEFPA